MDTLFKLIGSMLFAVGIAGVIIVGMAWLVKTDLSNLKLKDISFKFISLPKSFWVVISVVSALYGLFFGMLRHSVTPFDTTSSTMVSNFGQFGDSFGILNGLFSALGFAILLVTLFEQQKQLKDQQNEIDVNRSILIKQQFEQSFFSMLEMHHNIVRDIDIRLKDNIAYQGRDCFRYFLRKLKKALVFANSVVKSKDDAIRIATAYEVFFNKHQSDLGHYFRNLYNILKFVNNAPVNDKKTYTNYLRAQLSSHEVAILFYNCLSRYGCEMFRPLVVQYEFLEDMDFDLLLAIDHIRLYPNKAYGKSLLYLADYDDADSSISLKNDTGCHRSIATENVNNRF